jgi:5'-3' exonuclease
MDRPSPRYLIDSSIYIFGAYFSLPDDWHSPEGRPLNAVYGYTRFLVKFLMSTPLEEVAAAFDESLGSCFRNELYQGYKSSRELPDDALAFQLKACRKITELMGIKCYSSHRYEADDLIATLARAGKQQGRSVVVLSRDKDLGQVLEQGDFLWDFTRNNRLNVETFTAKYNVAPQQFADYLALMGDKSDDIPGIPGIGAKKASLLMQKFSDIESLLANIDDVSEMPIRGASAVIKSLKEHADELRLYKQLTRLEDNVPLEDSRCLYTPQKAQIELLARYIERLGLGYGLSRYCGQLKNLCTEGIESEN